MQKQQQRPQKPPYVHEVKDAAYAAIEWKPMIEPWAIENITLAMANVVEHMKQEGSDTDDELPLPAYAITRVRAAMKHIAAIDRKCDRDLERFKPKKGKYA